MTSPGDCVDFHPNPKRVIAPSAFWNIPPFSHDELFTGALCWLQILCGESAGPAMLRLVGGSDNRPNDPEPDDESTLIRRLSLAIALAIRQTIGGMESGTAIRSSGGVVAPVAGVVSLEPVDEMMARFAAEAALTLSAGYIQRLRTVVRLLCEHAGGAHPLEVKHSHIIAFFHALRSGAIKYDGKRTAACSGPTLRIYRANLRTFYQWAMRCEMIRADPTLHIPKPSGQSKAQRAFTLAQVAALIEAAERGEADPTAKCRQKRAKFYRFLAMTGCRIGEAEQLRWSDCNLHEAPPSIHIRPETNHARRARDIVLAPEDAAWLETLRGESEGRDVVLGPRPHSRVLPGDMKTAGVPRKDRLGRGGEWHCFRRFVGTEMARLGMNPKEAQLRLGHKDIETALTYYTDAENLEGMKAAVALADSLRGKLCKSVPETCVASDDLIESQRQQSTPMVETPTKTLISEARPGRSLAGACDHSGRGSVISGSLLSTLTGCSSVRPCVDAPPNGAQIPSQSAIDEAIRALALFVRAHTPEPGQMGGAA